MQVEEASMLKVLFLCTGNACRSQMAEGWARALKGQLIEACSAGSIAAGLDPRAVQVMAESGVDISAQRSKCLEQLRDAVTGSLPQYDFVVTLCDHAHETCPAFPGPTRIMHAGFDDPPSLAVGAATPQAALQHYRRVRDEIREFIERLPGALQSKTVTKSSSKQVKE